MSLDIVSFASLCHRLVGGKIQRGPANHEKGASCNLALVNNEEPTPRIARKKTSYPDRYSPLRSSSSVKERKKLPANVENADAKNPRFNFTVYSYLHPNKENAGDDILYASKQAPHSPCSIRIVHLPPIDLQSQE